MPSALQRSPFWSLSPAALFESSFQMTFLAIVAIGGIAVPFSERTFLPYARAADNLWDKWLDAAIPPRVAQFRVMLRLWSESIASVLGDGRATCLPSSCALCLWALELALIGTVAELVMVLPMAVYFHRATMFALPANMLSVPLVSVLAPVAVITFCASLLSPWIAMLPGAVTALLLHGDHCSHRPRERSSHCRPPNAGSSMVDGASGDRRVGLLLLGGATDLADGPCRGDRTARSSR